MTDGNLTTHIRTLQQAGYVSVTKSFQNNRPLTTCALTAAGRKAFTNYINLLERSSGKPSLNNNHEFEQKTRACGHILCDAQS